MADAAAMLKEDHEKVKTLFEEFEGADDQNTKKNIVTTALMELEIHAALEEEIFYPALRQTDDDEEHEDKMDEALEEHHVAKTLIAELQDMAPGDERYDAKFKVLGESVKHHIEEEESELIPKAEKELDLEALGQEMMDRKEQLMEEFQTGGRKRRTAKSGTRAARATTKRGRVRRTSSRSRKR
jgi:hemerythrin-like domain-containing protein